jgi:nucleoside-diphosphate-sugar epimerase
MTGRSLRSFRPRRARALRPLAARSAPAPADLSPYVARLDRTTGRELAGPVLPEETLVASHRDGHPLSLVTQVLASRLVGLTGGEWAARKALRLARQAGEGTAAAIGTILRDRALETVMRRLIGLEWREVGFRFRDLAPLPPGERKERIERLRAEGREAVRALGPRPRFSILLTGATGFLGREVLAQAARDPHVAEVVCLCRPLRRRHRRTGRERVLSPARRGALLLRELGLRGRSARKFRFVRGDVERPGLGLSPALRTRLLGHVTHVVHCAASVAFDAPFEESFRANVEGSRQALAFSLQAQRTTGAPFVAHVAVETSYIHGRTGRRRAREGGVEFPRHYYNNYYELTKALASLETERAMLAEGLRVIELLPSIIVGDGHTGNNRGDTKVVNAPVNAFGRARRALEAPPPGWAAHLRARLIGIAGTAFPADPSAEFNLVTLDRVGAAVLRALGTPAAIGAPIHLATDRRIRAADMARIVRDELGVQIWMADPTLTRTVVLPLARRLLGVLGDQPIVRSLEKLGSIFGFYSEWGQTVHDVGEDVRTLGLPCQRPDARVAFRMLCRHNRYVQEFGRVREPREVARREALWERVIDDIEFETGQAAALVPAPEFQRELEARLDLEGFHPRRHAPRTGQA